MGYIVYTGKIGNAYSKLENAEKTKNIAQKRVDEIDELIELIEGIDTTEVEALAGTAKEKAANVYNSLKEALEAQTPGSYKYEQLANLIDDIKETLETITSGTHADDSNVTVSEKLDSIAQNFDSLITELLEDANTLKGIKEDELSVATQAYNNAKTEFKNLLPINYSLEYLTLVALEDGTFSFYLGDSDTYMDSISYSIDNGETWVTYDGEDRGITALTTPTITTGNKVLWKGVGKALGDETSYFESTGRFNVQGNIMSLLYGDNFADKTQFDSEYQYQLSYLFKDTNVVDASNLILPATTLTSYCYSYMFYGCTILTKTPKLPATMLAYNCYGNMFENCEILTTAPELPATTLAQNCYSLMFQGCTNLTTAPTLPATTLANGCYDSMFYGCTSLTTPPQLPATTLADGCYNGMFTDCTSLTTAPELPATTLVDSCYQNMFYGCTSLNSITCLATDISANYCTGNWVTNVLAGGTFTKAASMSGWTTGNDGIPSGWDVADAD